MRFLESFGFGQRAPDVLRAQIASIAIEITNRCNLRCSYCHKADAGLEALPGSNDDMPPSRVLELYRYVKAANV
jgi:molybdenum cofactor biosynthesis enzyme MoaA